MNAVTISNFAGIVGDKLLAVDYVRTKPESMVNAILVAELHKKRNPKIKRN